jgi:hypothetical protein
MGRFLMLLFALSIAGTAISIPTTGARAEQRVISAQENIQLAQKGRCKAFGETNKCKPTWDMRTKSCVCAGT